MHFFKQIYNIAIRECGILMRNPIYGFCMVIFPILVISFFTSLMNNGLPTDMPVGVVDLDNTATTRSMIRHLDAFQTTKVVAEYNNVNEARQAIQENKIYAFLYIPRGTTDGLMTSSQPKISFYYSNVTLVAGSMLFRDLKTISSLGSASVGKTKLSSFGKTDDEIKTFLQPIAIDLHMIGNPWSNYNVYLSTVMVPGILMLFIFLLTPYSIGTELKFKRSKEWFAMAGNNPWIAITGKLLPQFMIFLTIFYIFEFYIYYILGFPHPGGVFTMLLLGFLAVVSAQGFGVFAFGLMPSLRMSMSICSLWAVVSFSTSGATYPAFSMNPIIQELTNLFPLRHYYMIYQINIFNGYPLMDAWFSISALILFALLPIFVMGNIKRAMLLYVYIP
ncbi:ABC transporter permease [Prevotella sp.]|jgi:ABC-type multidrug transport system, permease component|uniref:ABC transporter permease n=1 Tax=Prevotella sp. TaxID=59823 RepID=UPI003DA37CAE